MATRLRPVTETMPKSLLDVNGEPFIAHQLRLLQRNGIERVVVCAGYLGEQIEAAIGTGAAFGLTVEYSFDGDKLLGTAGALKRALPKLGADGTFFTLYGDSYLDCDYTAIAAAFAASGKPGLMTVFRNEGEWDSSNVEFDGVNILAYDKRRRSERMRHIDYGLGMFRREAFDTVSDDEPFDLAALYGDLLRRGQLAAYEVTTRFYEIGSFAGLEETRRYLAEKR
ncbi:MAG: NTP transferase domain-containing protein [Burkholderiales bacterium]|nr:NTP transferase domain-containing protein [Anaerolineae bacterium]